MGKIVVLIVFDQQYADTAFAHAQAFHHGDHHPCDGEVLAQDLEDLIGLTYDDHLIKRLPSAIPECLTKLELLTMNVHDHGQKGRRKEWDDTRYQ